MMSGESYKKEMASLVEDTKEWYLFARSYSAATYGTRSDNEARW